MADLRTALVTGSNRGIGLEVCRQLATRGLRVVLTGRSRAKAEAAARGLQAGGLDVHAEVLDVAEPATIRALAKKLGTVDVLVNNAAVLLDEGARILDVNANTVIDTFQTNVFGALAVSQAFIPGMVKRRYGRVVNVSSQAGQLAGMTTYAPAYSVSKTALNAITRQLAAATKGSGVLVNSACPGWVRTDMGGPRAPRSVEQGADTIVWLATLEAGGPSGGFFSDREPMAW